MENNAVIFAISRVVIRAAMVWGNLKIPLLESLKITVQFLLRNNQ